MRPRLEAVSIPPKDSARVRSSLAASSAGGPPRRRRRIVEGVLVLIGVVVLVDALFGERGLVEMMKARRQYQVLEQRLTEIMDQNDRLRDENARLRSDPATIEDVARRELGLIKPGEKLFTIRDRSGESK